VHAAGNRAAFSYWGVYMNPNVDFCGVIQLLRQLVERGHCTVDEATKIAARIAVHNKVEIIISV